MKVDEQRRGEVMVVTPQGPLIGSDAEQLGGRLVKAVNDGQGTIVLDASKIAFVDSRGLEALVDAAEQLIRGGRALKMAGANATLREVLELTELASLFEYFDDVDAAMGGLA